MGLKKKREKIVVAMSGGVDSSVCAALLKKRGFEVIGIFMKFWSEPKKDGLIGAENRCCSLEAEKRARSVAQLLDIPFYLLNFEREFKKRIVDSFLKEYKTGLTPNPCVVCNKQIKFGLLLEKTLKLGADYIATGHYARLRREIRNSKFEIRNYWYKLLKAKDKNKDQSYFLWMLNQKQLKRILFPIGDYTKDEVRVLAKKFRLPVLDVPESQEICFIQTDLEDFLARYLREKPGKIIDLQGKIIGQHQGLAFYTIGQRRRIKLPGGPFYVVEKKLKENTLIVAPSFNDKSLYKKRLIAKNVNWISQKPKLPCRVKAQIRYGHKTVPADLLELKQQGLLQVIFKSPQRAITPGQSIVFYKGKEILGGGIIFKIGN